MTEQKTGYETEDTHWTEVTLSASRRCECSPKPQLHSCRLEAPAKDGLSPLPLRSSQLGTAR